MAAQENFLPSKKCMDPLLRDQVPSGLPRVLNGCLLNLPASTGKREKNGFGSDRTSETHTTTDAAGTKRKPSSSYEGQAKRFALTEAPGVLPRPCNILQQSPFLREQQKVKCGVAEQPGRPAVGLSTNAAYRSGPIWRWELFSNFHR